MNRLNPRQVKNTKKIYLDQSVDSLSSNVPRDGLGKILLRCVKWEPADEVLVDPTVRARPSQRDVLRVQDRLHLCHRGWGWINKVIRY